MVNEVVKPVVGGRILDVMEDCFQNVHAESSRRQFLIKSGVDYSLENRNDSSKFVCVRGNLSNGPVDAEVKAGLNFECLDFFANVVNHLVQLMQVLLMELDDVSEKISLLFLGFDGGFEFGDLNRVVRGQRESSGCCDEGGHVPLSSLSLRYMWKACQKVLKKFKDLSDVGFVKFERAIERCPIVLGWVELETFQVWKNIVHTFEHFLFKMKECRVVEWDPNVAGESRSRVVSHWPETKL